GGLLGNGIAGAVGGSGAGSANGGAEATLIGTDRAGEIARSGAGSARNTVAGARQSAVQQLGLAQAAAGGATGQIGAVAGLAGNAGGSLAGNAGAIAGSAGGSANGSGALTGSGESGPATLAGMPVTNAKGRAIGFVQSVRTGANGTADMVMVEIGDRIVPVPASQLSGNGDVLVTAMSAGQLKAAAKDARPGEAQAEPGPE
ncbi:MAG: hypothetical protein ACT6SC_15650, partial [Blastomonas fulva]